MIERKVYGGEHVNAVISDMLLMAERKQTLIHAVHNGVHLIAYPGFTKRLIWNAWRKRLDELVAEQQSKSA